MDIHWKVKTNFSSTRPGEKFLILPLAQKQSISFLAQVASKLNSKNQAQSKL